jgi:hypothetical protein
MMATTTVVAMVMAPIRDVSSGHGRSGCVLIGMRRMTATLMMMEEAVMLLFIGTLKVPLPPEAAVGDAPTVCSQRAAMPTCQTYMKGE